MPRKKKTESAPKLWVITLAFVAVALAAGSLMFVFQQKQVNKNYTELQREINRLNKQIVRIVNPLGVMETSRPSVGSDQATLETSVRVMDKEYRFDSCGQLAGFVYEDWYDEFRDGLKARDKEPSQVTSSCLSSEGKMFIALIPSEGCKAPEIFKLNTETKTMGLAQVFGKGIDCLNSPEFFGRRDGTMIKLSADGSDGKCSWINQYAYHYGGNVLELDRQYMECNGKGTWTEY